MKIINLDFTVSTANRSQMIDITSQVRSVLQQSKVSNGDIIVYCPHTTAAITINENADPDVQHDMLMTFDDLIIQDKRGYRHCEGNSDSHCKCSLVGCSEQIIVSDGKMRLGTWQGIYFCEFDGPRTRKVFVQIKGK